MSFVPKGSVSKQVEKKKAKRLELSAFFQLLQKDSILSSQWKSTMIMTQKNSIKTKTLKYFVNN